MSKVIIRIVGGQIFGRYNPQYIYIEGNRLVHLSLSGKTRKEYKLEAGKEYLYRPGNWELIPVDHSVKIGADWYDFSKTNLHPIKDWEIQKYLPTENGKILNRWRYGGSDEVIEGYVIHTDRYGYPLHDNEGKIIVLKK